MKRCWKFHQYTPKQTVKPKTTAGNNQQEVPCVRTLPVSSAETEVQGPDTIYDNSIQYHPTIQHQLEAAHKDHAYSYAAKELSSEECAHSITALKKENKQLRDKVRYLKNKMKSMSKLLNELKEKSLLTEDIATLLKNKFPDDKKIVAELVENADRANVTNKFGMRYSESVKQFAVTLHYYSPKAYDFIKKLFHLPDVTSIRHWLSSFDCQPGCLMSVLSRLKEQVNEDNTKSDVCMIIDAMSLRKQITWDKKHHKYSGCTDYGSLEGECGNMPAKDALCVMIVGLVCKNFKVVIGFFFTACPTGHILHEMVKEGLQLLYGAGMNVHAVVWDGTSINKEASKLLGCKFTNSYDTMVNNFPHPTNNAYKVNIIFDICHMLKLMRNCLGDFKVLKFPYEERKVMVKIKNSNAQHERKLTINIQPKCKIIKWDYIELLHKVQQEEGLVFGTKLNTNHIQWEKRKMNVKLAAQTFSTSVADAIQFLGDDLKYKEFEGSEGTACFLRQMDLLFDILNSRNHRGSYSKAPIFPSTYNNIKEKLENLAHFLLSLTTSNGEKLISSRRGTTVTGFCMTIKSVIDIANNLFNREVRPARYLLKYRLSQDHLEIFFQLIRLRGGSNNNPSPMEFIYAVRGILCKQSVYTTNCGNCLQFETNLVTPVFTFKWSTGTDQAEPHNDNINTIIETLDTPIPNEYKSNVLCYIAGYIVRKLIATDILCNLQSSFVRTGYSTK